MARNRDANEDRIDYSSSLNSATAQCFQVWGKWTDTGTNDPLLAHWTDPFSWLLVQVAGPVVEALVREGTTNHVAVAVGALNDGVWHVMTGWDDGTNVN